MKSFSALMFLFSAVSGLFSLTMSSATSSLDLERQVTALVTESEQASLVITGLTNDYTGVFNTENFYESIGTVRSSLSQAAEVVLVITPTLENTGKNAVHEGGVKVGITETAFDFDTLDPIEINFVIQSGQTIDIQAVFNKNKDTLLNMSFAFHIVGEDGIYNYSIVDSIDTPLNMKIK